MEIRNATGSKSLILGNGDITSLGDAREMAIAVGLDGVMVGRGIYGKPWFFDPKTASSDVSHGKVLEVMLEHARLFEETYSQRRNFAILRKFFNSYISGFPSAKAFRLRLMGTNSADEVEDAIAEYTNANSGKLVLKSS